jgi:hypothetical protein
VAALEKLYGISLARPQFETLKSLSKFCEGLVEKDASHPWQDAVKHLAAQSRFGLSHSLFLFRKVIPKEKPSVEKYCETLSCPQEAPDPDFLRFALRMTKRLFPVGWDRTYNDRALTSSLPTTSCSEQGRKEGGCRGLEAEKRWQRSDFCNYVLNSSVSARKEHSVSRVQAVETSGKWRIIAIPPRVDNALRPLHKAMYSRLSQFSWLLRGDAKPNRFKEFTPVDGEVFVSGDYESATDNLNSALQVAILETLLDRSYTVPQGIIEHAVSTYSSRLIDESGRSYVQRRGQLMGQLTSFPMLCLINYITFRYSVPRDVPVRINGDDIVFRATPEEYSSWERNVVKGGLTLSKGKTFLHRRAFTLNSTPFWSCRGGAKLVGFLRSSALFPKGSITEQIVSLNGRFYSAGPGFGRIRKRVVHRLFIEQNQKAIHASRRSLTRGLGLAVDEELIKDTGLWYRELFYLEQVEERPLPVVGTPLPPGWKQVSSSWMSSDMIEEWGRRWSDACVYHAWTANYNPKTVSDDVSMDKIRMGCLPYGLGTLISAKVRRMLKMSRSAVWKWVNLRRNPSVFGRVKRNLGSRVWVEVDLLATRTQVEFLASASTVFS